MNEAHALRPYQVEAITAIRGALKDGKKRFIVQAATGTGKTRIMSEICSRAVERGSRAIIIAERRDLIYQTRDRLRNEVGIDAGLEMADHCDLSESTLHSPSVIVASVQTLSKRLGKVPTSWADLVICDEAHHCAAKSYRDVIDHFACPVVGFTATPERGDGQALGEVFVDDIVFSYPIEKAISDGYLARISQFRVRTDVDFSAIRTTAGDFNTGDLDEVMRQESALVAIADPIIEVAKGRPTLAFCVTVQHAHDLAKTINARTNNAGYAIALDGTANDETRARVIDAVKRGEYKVLVNCAMFLEGFDWPACEFVAMARPTKSRPLFIQMAGRGTRLSPSTGKTHCTILDYVGNSGRHKLVTSLDIFADSTTDEVIDEALESILAGENDRDEEDDGPRDVQLLLSDAQRKLAQKHIVTRWQLIKVDPFAAVGIDLSIMRDGVITTRPTQEQIERLERHGIKRDDLKHISAQRAREILTRLNTRFRSGLCTPKQARILARNGIDPLNVTFEQASKWIDEMIANNWTATPSILSSARQLGVLQESIK